MSSALPARRAEQITATVLFADVVGFSALSAASGTETAYLVMTGLLRLLDGIARRHGGSVDKYLGDKLLAVFGYPMPLESPARAAALAALEMRQRVAEYEAESGLDVALGIHIGINTGELVGGDIAGPVVREFHVLGDAVNVAARLNAKAPTGSIWVGSRTWEECGDAFVWQEIEPLKLKGKSRPVPAFALQAERGAIERERLGFDERRLTNLFGRDEELARLQARVAALAGGSGGAVLLSGEEGIGKSRLLAELGETSALGDLSVLQVRASSSDRSRPLASLAPLFEGVSEAGVEARVEHLTAAARTRPTLLVVEDVQWLDPDSEALLEQLAALTPELPLLLVLTARPEAAQRWAERLRECAGDGCEHVELGGLSGEQARALVEGALEGSEDEEAVGLVLERGGGNPARLLLAAFLAPALRSERAQGSEHRDRSQESERRRAAVLFADITGFTAMTEKVGAEAAYPVVAACLQILDEVTRKYGGTVDHYLGDCVMALFGVPTAIEDAPRAALNAAIEMRQRIQTFNAQHELAHPVDVHTGVATGHGIAGDISGPLIREFAVMGDHVDRADLLTHVASAGEIRIDDETYRATREVFDFQSAEALDLPGFQSPHATWDVASTAPRLHRARIGTERKVFSPLVGRDAELGSLRAKLVALAAGQGGIANIVAEAGVGKSRLMSELVGSDEARAVSWLEGRALSNGRNLSFHPIADLFRTWSGADDEDGEEQARQKLDELVRGTSPDDADEIAPLLANLMGLPLRPDEQERMDGIQGDAAEKLVRAAMVRLLRAASSQRPLVVVMEDLHWADLSSVELVESLLRLVEEHPILFLSNFRPGFEATSGRVLEAARAGLPERHLEIALRPLDDRAARQMVKNLFRGGEVPQVTRQTIEQRARGNPFYIEEVVRTLVQAGAVELRDGRFHATEKLESVVIPGTVQEAIMARVDRLARQPKSVLQAASVVGGTFHLDVLEEMVDDPAKLPDLIDQLEESEFISPSDRTAGLEYAFKHPLIQEVTYDAILEARREELHRDVARATERRLADNVSGYFAMLAFHFSKGRDAERAEEYLFKAGDEAARVAASSEALQFFEEASALYLELHGEGGDPRKRALLQKNVALALLNRGRLLDAVDHFDEATAFMGERSSRKPVRMAAVFAANLVRVLSSLYLPRARNRRAATPDEVELFDVMFKRAMAQSTAAPTRFFVDSMALLRRLSKVDPFTVPEAAAMYSGVVGIFSYSGLSFDIGRQFLDIARELADGGAVKERRLYYRTLRFLHNMLEGDWSDTHAVDPELLEEGLREGRFWEVSTYLNLDGLKHLYRGDFAGTRERIRKLSEVADLYEHGLADSARLALGAYLHVERRELDQALGALDLYYDEHAEPLFNLLALGTRAKVELLRGDTATAIATVERAEALLGEAGRAAPFHASSVRSARQLVDVTLLEELRGGAGEAKVRRRLARSRKTALATASKVAWRRPEALRLAARESWLLGREREAVAGWERAVECCERLGTRPELGRTLAEAGRALAQGDSDALRVAGRDANACLAEARAIFDELDLAFDRELLAVGA